MKGGRVLFPLVKSLLQSSHVERLSSHTHEIHDFEKLVFSGLIELLDIVSALGDEDVVIGEEIRPLKHSVQLELGLVGGLIGHDECSIGVPSHSFAVSRGHSGH